MDKLGMKVILSWKELQEIKSPDGKTIQEALQAVADRPVGEVTGVMGVLVQTEKDGLYFVKFLPNGHFEFIAISRRNWDEPSTDTIGLLYVGG